jgi:uncharacterized protein (TIGR00304 family)
MAQDVMLIGILLIIAGFMTVAVILLLELLRSLRKGETKVEKRGGAVVMIGPIPIIMASDPRTAKVLLMLAIILTVILVVLTIFSFIRVG